MQAPRKEALYYVHSQGKAPFEVWLEALRDTQAKAIIRARIRHLELGYRGNCKSLSHGLFELKIHYGPGYRVYYGEDQYTLIIILYGGDKGSQKRDIKKAQKYWAIYRSQK